LYHYLGQRPPTLGKTETCTNTG